MAEPSDRRTSSPQTLVFIHGSGDSARVWDGVIERLTEYSCVALDLPGHGTLVDRSGPPDMSVSDYVDAVRTELMRRELTGACVIGHSLGSAIALRLALEYPSLASALVLVGAGARLRVLPALLEEARNQPERTRARLVELGTADMNAALRQQYIASSPPCAEGVLYRDLAACDAFDVMGELARIAQPALVVVGDSDRLTPPKYAEYLRDHLPAARLVVIKDAGHYLALEQPEQLAAAMRSWLSTL